jgi:uncharacterized membrane protein YdjX (TVP38/TMEM64 family)
MTAPPPASDPAAAAPRPRRPVSLRAAILRFTLLVLVLAIGFLAFRWTPLSDVLTRENMVGLMEQLRAAWWAPLALVGLYLLVAPTGLPVSPLIFAGGVVFGVWWGSLYNFFGTLVGASASYLLARALGRDLIVHVTSETLLARAERILERHGFWTLVRVRFLPIPFAISNFGAALAGIRWPVFITASVLGLAPSMVLWTYFGYAIVSVTTADRQVVIRNLVVAVALALGLTFLVPLRNAWKRRRYGR